MIGHKEFRRCKKTIHPPLSGTGYRGMPRGVRGRRDWLGLCQEEFKGLRDGIGTCQDKQGAQGLARGMPRGVKELRDR